MSSATVKVCGCEHHAQDIMHGEHRRVHNLGIKSNRWRCTVCGNEKLASDDEIKRARKGVE